MADTVERGLVTKSYLTDIGDAIRAKNKTTTKYKPSEMAQAISALKSGDLQVATSDKFTFKVVQSANQIITSKAVGKSVDNSDGTISLALTDETTISPNTNYIPGAVSRSYDDSTHTYTVTATDAEAIDGLVQDGWSVVYQKEDMGYDRFYTASDYSGSYITGGDLQGNILIGGMVNPVVNKYAYRYPRATSKIIKYKNSIVTDISRTDGTSTTLDSCPNLTEVSMGNLQDATNVSMFQNCTALTSVELPNLRSIGKYSFSYCSSLTSIKLPELTTGSYALFGDCNNLAYIEAPKLATTGDNTCTGDTSLLSVEFPSLTKCGEYFLLGATNVRSIEIPKAQEGRFGTVDNSKRDLYFVDAGSLSLSGIPEFIQEYTKVMIRRGTSMTGTFYQSKLSSPVLYIVPSALVDTYKSKVRSTDYVTALEESPFRGGKTECGNNMQTLPPRISIPSTWSGVCLEYDLITKTWDYLDTPASAVTSFLFNSKLTREGGYRIRQDS